MSAVTVKEAKTIKTLNNIAESGLNVFKEGYSLIMIVRIQMPFLYVVSICILWNLEAI
ncbi:hypothetical protein JCM9140_4319 [Halalkalibacter wakoensis JCM 9140]|uniref:Uncharacterized protein n=1 Tax=Halalkalibacter wakoensis JCM 9140 TaxID=1236970 RepID=W4Q9Q8_9BACI|nr:hypothetical protein JCM9140_4319 [Halalkalibacter wakoensis JCM 9140]